MFNFLKTTRGEKGKKKEKGNRVTTCSSMTKSNSKSAGKLMESLQCTILRCYSMFYNSTLVLLLILAT
jgi:hypothetical protein